MLAEPNTLQFRCDCGHTFEMVQPKGKWIRNNSKTNFFIPIKEEHGAHTPIHCPACNRTNGIRRVAKSHLVMTDRTTKRSDLERF